MDRPLFIFLRWLLFSLSSTAQLRIPAASPRQEISQRFGTSFISLSYGRPSLRGRSVFQQRSLLAPLGEIWRTGANAPTTFHVGEHVTIGEMHVDSGRYSLFVIPFLDHWTVILNSSTTGWGAYQYNDSLDVLRLDIPAVRGNTAVETFTIQFSDIKVASCTMEMAWSTTKVRIPISTDLTALKESVKLLLSSGQERPNDRLARYYLEVEPDTAQALEHLEKALAQDSSAFWLWSSKSEVLERLGRHIDARRTAEQCVHYATLQQEHHYIRTCTAAMERLSK